MKLLISAPAPAPLPQWGEFERLAREGLAMACAGETEECRNLAHQASNSSFEQIDYTGAGFFVGVTVLKHVPALARTSGVIGDVHARCSNNQAPLGLLVFIREGRIGDIEMFAYGDWPEDLSEYRCHYLRWEPIDAGGYMAAQTEQRDLGSMWDR